MEIKQLTYFVTVVHMGNISSAAKKLHISQPPLSLQMKLLEEELGVVLFERGARRIVLTECGKLFYERAMTVLNILDHTQDEVQNLNSGVSGLLRIGLISSASPYFIGNVLEEFCRQWQEIHFSFSEGNTYQLLELLQENVIELAVVRTPFSMDGFEGIRMKKEPMMAVGMPEFFETCKKGENNTISLRELSGVPLILYRRWEEVLRDAFAKAVCEMNVRCKVDDARTALLCAQKGFGVGIMPASIVPMDREDGTMRLKIDCEELNSSILLLHAKNKQLSGAAQALVQYVMQMNTDVM